MSGTSVLVGLGREMRPWQWYKQLIVLIPVVFSLSAFELEAWLRAVTGALLFSFLAGSIYIVNDIADREEDRNHPRKKHRPIASGQVSVGTGVAAVVVLLISSLGIAWWLSEVFFGILVVYVVQNTAYSFALKQFLLVDLFLIGFGFILRALAGVVLISAVVSPWLLISTFLTALLLGSGKRWGELQEMDDPRETRSSLEEYSERLLQFIFFCVATTLLVSYTLYTFFAQGLAMMVTIPFAFYAVFRYGYLVFEHDLAKPRSLFRDRASLANFVLWGIAVVVALYTNPNLGGILQ